MNTTTATPARTVIDRMVAEGHDRADVQAAFDSMVDAGLELDDQPDDGYILTADEVEMLFDQVGATYTQDGMIRVHGNHRGYFDSDGGEWQDEVDAILADEGYRRTGPWTGDHAPAVSRFRSPALFDVTTARVEVRRADAALRSAVRAAKDAGEQKVAIAAAAGITRPTLDAWLG